MQATTLRLGPIRKLHINGVYVLFKLKDRMSRTKAFKIIVLGGTGVRLLQIGNNLLIIPLILAKIGAEQYGYWLATGGILAWASTCDFGVVGIVKQRCSFFLGKNNTDVASTYFHTGLVVYSFLLILMLIVVYGLSFLLHPLLDFPEIDSKLYRTAFMLAGLAMALSILKTVFGAYLHASRQPSGGVISSAVGQLVNLLLVIYLLLWTSLGLWAIPIGLLANQLISVCLIVCYVFKHTRVLHTKPVFKREIFHDYFTISPVMFLARMGSQLTAKIEPTLIVMFINPELATMFTVAKRLIEVMMSFANTVRAGMIAGFSHYFGEKGAEATIDLLDRILQMTVGFSFAITLVYLATNRYFVNLWVGRELYIGTLICVFIGLEALTKSVGDSMLQLVGALGEMRRSSIALFAESVIKVGLMFLFLPLIGIVGLPVAALLSGVGKAIYSISRLKQNLDDVRLDMTCPLLGSAVALGLLFGAALIGSFGTDQNPWLWLPMSLLVSCLFAGLFNLWAFPFIRKEVFLFLTKFRLMFLKETKLL
jgi:O-antigen/teichoic acid export membrane protein